MAKRKYFLKRVLSVAVSASLIASSANVPVMATESEAETQTETSLEEETEAQTSTEGESETETQASTEEEVKSEAQTAETESETETQTKTEEKSEEETKAETETQTETESATETEVVEVVEEEEADNVQAEVEEEEADAEGEVEVQEDGNLLTNGDFSQFTEIDSIKMPTDWTCYGINSCGTVSVNEDGVAVINHKWNEGNDWNIQLYQDGLAYGAGDYVVTFDAWASVERPMSVKLQIGDNVIEGTVNTVALSEEKQSYKIVLKDLVENSGVKLDFHMGNVTLGELTTPNDPNGERAQNHNIYLDNIVFRSATEEEVNAEPASITLSGATILGQSVDISYVENSANNTWLEANKTVYVNGVSIASDKVTFKEDNSGFTIADDVFTEIGRYKIHVVAEGFDATNIVYKNIIGTDGNLIFDGDMSNASSWFIHNESADLGTGNIADGKYTLNYIKGRYSTYWENWTTQLKKENISVKEGTYLLRFKASTDLAGGRDINIEDLFGSYSNQKTVHIDKGDEKYYEVEYEIDSASDEFYICFLTGAVGGLCKDGEVPHTLTIDDVSLIDVNHVASDAYKSELKSLVAEERTEADYTADTWKTYSDALTSAKSVADSETSTIKDVRTALKTLQTAIKGLKLEGFTSIVVSEQVEQLVVGNDIVLTYVADNDAFDFGDDYTLKINGTEKDTTNVEIDESTITIPASFNTAEGVLEIQFVKDSCEFTPVYQKVYKDTTEDEWTLIWQDEFNGDKLDETKWDHQIGIGTEYTDAGWGNKEEQYYTDSEENSKVEDGKLTITAKKDANAGSGAKYTSARIRTVTAENGKTVDGVIQKGESLQSAAYGKIEAKMKLPAGKGVWPAFWMLPFDSEYGTWATSGEIDIMEARGRLPQDVCGTLHFGDLWPNNVSNGVDYTFPEGEDITGYHIYTVEWDPDKITWLVDGVEYGSVSNWYSVASEEGNWPYPAPFDEEFYILFNLAVGGTFDSAVSSSEVEVDENGVSMDVDYVRWYQRDAEVYENWNIQEPEVEKDEANKDLITPVDEATGNFLHDTDFVAMNTTPNGEWSPETEGWIPLTADTGKATWSKVKNGEDDVLKVEVEDTGSQTYSVQMLQHLPLVKGYSYEVSYTAYTDSTNPKADLSVQMGGDNDNSWAKYSSNFVDELTATPTTYTHKFTMSNTTDPTARLELNLATSAGNVYLSDFVVKLTEIKETDGEDDAKAPLDDGNHIYNGDFKVGSDSLLYWHWSDDDSKDVVSIDKSTGDRRLKAIVGETPVEVWQNGINLLQADKYQMSFDVNTEEAQDIVISFTSKDGKDVYATKTESLVVGANKVSYEFTQPEGKTDKEAKVVIEFAKTVTMDKVKLIRTTNNNVDFDNIDIWPLYNGDFFNGKDGWNIWSEGNGYQSAIVNEAGQLESIVKIGKDATQWCAGIQSSDMMLAKGVKYKVKFDYELPEAKSYALELAGEKREITLEAGKHTYTSDTFIGTGNTKLTLYLGPVESEEYILLLDNVEVYIDEESLEVPEGYAKPASLATSGQYKAGNSTTILFTDNTGWEAATKEYYINGEKIANDKVSIDTEKNTITFDGSVFPTEGKYTVKVTAEGFTDTKTISVTVISADNWLVNGDFSKGTEGWGFYFADWSNGSGGTAAKGTLSVNDEGVAVVNHEYNAGEGWHIQLYQDNIIYDAGTYILEFDAWSDIARPIGVQLQNGDVPIEETINTIALSTEKQSFKLVLKNLAANSGAKLDFPMGNVTLGDLTTPKEAHNIYLDNVVLRPATEDDLNTQPATITLSGATTLGQSVDVSYATDSANDKWLAANKTVYVNGTAVAADKVTFKEDKTGFTIAGDVFTAVGRYEIYVVAEGFDATNKISKNIIGTDGELIFDGDLTNAGSWTAWDENAAGLSDGEIADGIYTLDYNSGYCHKDGYWVTWSSQLIKENISINKDGKYELKFKASTDLTDGRDIIIEYGTEKQKTVHIDQGEAKEYMVELDLTATDAQAIKFLVGPVGANLQLDTTNAEGANTVPHKLTIDDISLKAASEGSGTVTVDKSALQTLVDAQDKKEADYTTESWKAYSEALTAAKAVLEKADATADEVAAAKTALETAIAGLVKASTGDTTVDKSALKTLVDAQDKKEADYTAESWKAYSEALANAKAVLDKADATADEVAAAKTALETAIAGLVEKTVERQGLWGVIVGYAENEKAVYGYTGSAIKPEVKVYNGNDLLVEKKDYTVKYSDNINAGTAKIEITGKGNFVDTKTIEFTIDGKDINTLDVDNLYALMDANGSVKEPKLAVKDGKKKLVDGKDYTYTIASYKNAEGKAVAGSYDVIITGKDNYKGTKTIKFDVLASNTPVMAKAKITMTPNKVSYSDYISGKYNPTVTVKIGKEKGYVKDTDFTVVCPTDISAGKVAVTVVGKDGKIYGSKDVMINVEGVKLGKNITVEGIAATGYDYTGTELKVSNLVLKDGADKLEEGKDYSVEYSKNVTPGNAKVVITGKGKYTGKLTKTFKINKVAMTNAAIKVDCAATAAYSKAGARPELTVTYNGMTLVEKKDYTVTCKNNKKVGDKATLVITGKGNYSGKLEKAEAYTVTVPTADAINASVADIYKKDNMTFANFKKAVKVKVTEASTGKALKAKKDYAKEFKLYVKEGDNRIELTEEAFATLAVGVPVYAEITLAGSYAEEGKETKVEAVFKLYDKKAGTLTVEAIDPQPYTGKAVEPKPVVKDGTTVLKEGVDYKLTYSKNIKKGTAKVTITGIGNGYGGSKTVKFKIKAAKMTW